MDSTNSDKGSSFEQSDSSFDQEDDFSVIDSSVDLISNLFSKNGPQDQPRILKELLCHPSSEHPRILEKLVPLDIRIRMAGGESPVPRDYSQLGSLAVKLAREAIALELGFHEDSAKTVLDESTFADELESDGFGTHASRVIDNFQLIEPIGKGGMGSVWKAEQHAPIKRTVALKLIRKDVNAKNLIARFNKERNAIAQMNHENIANLLSAGETETGIPYFAMELVDGITLDKYCDQNKLGLRDRLRLLVDVCKAVQHAHQKRIIHRDLKHSNVLVCEVEGKAVPKVIDFGLARVVHQDQTRNDGSLFTEIGKAIGTPEYMSPEQAYSSSNVDTRCDIFSLGAMAYKLMVGSTPFDRKFEREDISLLEMLDLIRDLDPVTPSQRLKTLNSKTLSDLAEIRNVKPEKLSGLIKGDIDSIIQKSIAHDPEERYATAMDMARDIERYLNSEPVHAVPPSNLYRAKKFVRRNSGLVAVVVGMIFLISFAALFSWFQMIEAQDQRDVAEAERKRANKEKAIAEVERGRAENELYARLVSSCYTSGRTNDVESALKGFSTLMSRRDHDERMPWELRYLRSEIFSSDEVFYGHAGRVNAMILAPDGKTIVSACRDHKLRLWDTETQTILDEITLVEEPTSLDFSKDGAKLACVDRSDQITIRENFSQTPQTVIQFESDVNIIQFAKDDQLILASFTARDTTSKTRDNPTKIDGVKAAIKLIRITDQKVIGEIELDKPAKHFVATDSADTILVCLEESREILYFEKTEDGYSKRDLKASHSDDVLGFAISPDEKYFASCSADKSAGLWSLESGELVTTFAGHIDAVTAVAFSRDNKLLTGSDRTARIWDINDRTELSVFNGHLDQILCVAFSPVSQKVFTGSRDMTMREWDTKNANKTQSYKVHNDEIWQTCFLKSSNSVVSVSEDGRIAITNLTTGEQKPVEHSQPSQVNDDESESMLSIVALPMRKQFLVGSSYGVVRLFNDQGEQQPFLIDGKEQSCLLVGENYIWDIDVSPDGSKVATASADGLCRILDTSTWKEIKPLRSTTELGSVRFSHDSRFLVTAGEDRKVRLWDAVSFKLIDELEDHPKGIWRAIFSPDGKTIAASCHNGTIHIWDVESRTKKHVLEAHSRQIAGLTFSECGNRLFSASDDELLKVWDIHSGTQLLSLRDPSDTQIVSVELVDDGSKLISTNATGWITVRPSPLEQKCPEHIVLPNHAIKRGRFLLEKVHDEREQLKSNELKEMLDETRGLNSKYPSYVLQATEGILQYRLGNIDKAIDILEEAHRMQNVLYGEPDEEPLIEGYLTLAYYKAGNRKLADTYKSFVSDCKEDRFKFCARVQDLRKWVDSTVPASLLPKEEQRNLKADECELRP